MRAGTPMRSPRYGNCSTTPMTFALNGVPFSGFTDSTMPEHAADVQHLDDVAFLTEVGK